MKRYYWLGIFILALLLAGNLFAQPEKTIYLNVAKENLRLSPQGTIIGEVLKGTELYELERQGKWVKVALTAWVWAPSTTEEKDKALGPKNRASLIMVEEKPKAEAILGELKAGKSFEVIAKEKSIHPTGGRGGDLGEFRRGDFDAKIENAIFAIQPGQTSQIVEISLEGQTFYCIFKRIQ
jgi:parvulin-like peptidyl-prolyl isomerase